MLGQLSRDLLQLAFMGFQLFLLQESMKSFRVQKEVKDKHKMPVKSSLFNDFSLSKQSSEPLLLSPSNCFRPMLRFLFRVGQELA